MPNIFPQIPCGLVALSDELQKLTDERMLIRIGDKVEYVVGYVDGLKVVTFQGTASWNDWQDNLESWQETVYLYGNKVKVFKGVYDQSRIAKEVIIKEQPNVIQGHSLAGGIVQVLCANYNIPTVTWGGLRAGNRAFANLLTDRCVRIHHRGDKVPYIPWRVWPTWHRPWVNFYTHGDIPVLRIGERNNLLKSLLNKEHHILSYVSALRDHIAAMHTVSPFE